MTIRNKQEDTCLVLLTDTLYLPGSKRLIESFFEHNPKLSIVVLSDDRAVFQDPDLKERSASFVEIDSTKYKDITPYKKRKSKRHSRTFYKFEAFANFGYRRNIFVDSDVLCLGPCPLLFSSDACVFQAALDTGFRKTRGYKGSANEINSGVMVIDAAIQGEATMENLRTIAQNNPGRGGYNSGDQGIINKWIRNENIPLSLLPQSYNLIKKDYFDEENIEQCSLLHFADRKPWFKSSTGSMTTGPLESLWHANASSS